MLTTLAGANVHAVTFGPPIHVTARDWGNVAVMSHELARLDPIGLVVTYTTYEGGHRLSCSPDGGFDWPGAVPLAEPEDTEGGGGISPVVRLEPGVLGVVWMTIARVFGGNAARVYFARVDSLGRWIGEPTWLGASGSTCCDVYPRLRLSGNRLVAAWYRQPDLIGDRQGAIAAIVSEDRGATWLDYREFGPETGGSLGVAPELAVAPDGTFYACTVAPGLSGGLSVFRLEPGASDWVRTSEPDGSWISGGPSLDIARDGTLAMAISLNDAVGFSPPTIEVFISVDRGDSWTRRASFHAPEPGEFGSAEPRLATDGRGDWHLAWCNPWNRDETDVYYARSTGSSGMTWTSPTRVNPAMEPARREAPRSIAIATDEDGHAYITYLRRLSQYEHAIYLVTTRERPGDGLEDLPFFTISAAPNPSREWVTLALPVPGPATASLRVYDAGGHLIRAWPSIPLVRGVNRVHWDGWTSTKRHAPPGVYYWHARIAGDARHVVRDVRGRLVRGQR